jgi:hypothetical protein
MSTIKDNFCRAYVQLIDDQGNLVEEKCIQYMAPTLAFIVDNVSGLTNTYPACRSHHDMYADVSN